MFRYTVRKLFEKLGRIVYISRPKLTNMEEIRKILQIVFYSALSKNLFKIHRIQNFEIWLSLKPSLSLKKSNIWFRLITSSNDHELLISSGYGTCAVYSLISKNIPVLLTLLQNWETDGTGKNSFNYTNVRRNESFLKILQNNTNVCEFCRSSFRELHLLQELDRSFSMNYSLVC